MRLPSNGRQRTLFGRPLGIVLLALAAGLLLWYLTNRRQNTSRRLNRSCYGFPRANDDIFMTGSRCRATLEG